jgi:hypothetical protein
VKAAAKEMNMELEELVERIQRWRVRQSGGTPMEAEPRAYRETPPPFAAAPVADAAPIAEEQLAELEAEPEAAALEEEATAEVDAEQIEEVG